MSIFFPTFAVPNKKNGRQMTVLEQRFMERMPVLLLELVKELEEVNKKLDAIEKKLDNGKTEE